MASHPRAQYSKRRPRRRSVFLCAPHKKPHITHACPSSLLSGSRTRVAVRSSQRSSILIMYRFGFLWLLLGPEWNLQQTRPCRSTVSPFLTVFKHQKSMRRSDGFRGLSFSKTESWWPCLPCLPLFRGAKRRVPDTLHRLSPIAYRCSKANQNTSSDLWMPLHILEKPMGGVMQTSKHLASESMVFVASRSVYKCPMLHVKAGS